ncbi:hypothetical protein BLA29_008973, partial [Euroglyphus maynei]
MKRIKKELSRQRRDQRRLTLPSIFDQPKAGGYRRLRSDSVTAILPISTGEFRSDQEPMAMLSDELSANTNIKPEFEANENSLWWPNVDDPGIFQRNFRIEFFHIPDWNRTKKFYALFRILSDDDDDEARIPVSIRDPFVRSFINEWDWVGIFPEKFTSLDNFLTYSYPRFGNVLPTEQAADALSMLNINDDNSRDFDHHDSQQGDQHRNLGKDNSSSSSTTTTTTDTADQPANPTEEVFSVHFDEQIPILAGRYVLVYIRKNGDVIGVSEP